MAKGMIKTKKYAAGTAQVPQPVSGPTPPKPGDTQTSGNWGTSGQNQNLRAQLGYDKPPAPKGLLGLLGFAEGTENVPAAASTPPGLLDNLIHFRAGPLVVGNPALSAPAPQLPQPATTGQPGGSVPPNFVLPPNLQGFNAPVVPEPNFQFNPPAQAFPTPPVAAPKGSPQTAQMGFNAPLPPMPAMTPPAAPGEPSLAGKTMGAVLNIAPKDADLHLNAGQMSQHDFATEFSKLPLNTIQKLWGMQHYLTPEQKILPTVVGQYNDRALQAQAMYDNAVKAGKTAELPALKKTSDDAAGALHTLLIQSLALQYIPGVVGTQGQQ